MRRTKNPTISVIVPAYNVERFIGKCLESILAQTYQDFEVLVINDGSTDNTPEILEVFEKKDQRIKVIFKENAGVSAARNTGLDEAKGEYIMFVDGDDYIEPNTLEDSYQYIKKHNADVCLFGHQSISWKNGKKEIRRWQDVLLFCGYFEDAPKEFFSLITTVWGKLYKNNKLLPRFNEQLKKIEDGAFLWEYYLNHPKITILNNIYYDYVHHQGSAIKDPKLAEELSIQQSLSYVKTLAKFQALSPKRKAQIVNRYALSTIREIKEIYQNKKWPKAYKRAIGGFLLENFNNEIIQCDDYCNLLHLYLKQCFPLLSKIYQTTTQNGLKTTKIFGIKFEKKITRRDLELKYIKKLEKNQAKYERDTYLLIDCLDGDLSECNDAYSLFLYMKDQGLKAYYVLLKQNPFVGKLAKEDKLENVIIFPDNTYKVCFFSVLYDVLLKTKAIIVSHSLLLDQKYFLAQNPYIKYFYIQHGQTYLKEHILGNGYLDYKKFNYAAIPSDFEWKVFKKYGWSEDQFIKSPLPRWDLLPQKSAKKKKILIMFTWRHMKKENFEKSIYKRRILALLNNEEFDHYLQEKGIELYFALHHSLLGYRQVDFKTGYKNVVPMDQISQYIKECSLLITDFSSVSFDFMFQNKPVLFYLLDHDDPKLSKSDKQDMQNMTYKKYFVDNVFYSFKDTFEKLKYYVEHRYALEPETKEKYAKFFYFKKDIRKRLTQEIEKICSSSNKGRS